MAYRLEGDVLVARDLTASGSVAVSSGSAGDPSFKFAEDPDSGLYSQAGYEIAVVASGTTIASFENSGINPQFKFADGSETRPGLSFLADPDSGFTRVGSNFISLTLGGSRTVDFSTADVDVLVPLRAANGTVDNPSIGFSSEGDVGLYRPAINQMAVSVSGTQAVIFDGSSTETQALFNTGSATRPGISFIGNNNTGIARVNTDELSFVVGGGRSMTLSTTELTMLSGRRIVMSGDSATSPGYRWAADNNTGFYHPAADVVGVSAGGEEVAKFANTGSGPQVLANTGSTTVPGYGFSGNEGTGFSGPGSNINFIINDTREAFMGTNHFSPGADAGMALGLSTVGWTVIYGRQSGGSEGSPTYTWASDIDTGIYKPGADQVGITAGGDTVATFVNTSSNPQVILNDGSAAVPALVWESDNDEGLYRSVNNGFSYAADGAERIRFTQSQIQHGDVGASNAPTYSFLAHTNTGMRTNGSGGTLAFTALGNDVLNLTQTSGLDGYSTAELSGDAQTAGSEGYRGIYFDQIESGNGDASATLGGINRLLDLSISGTTVFAVAGNNGSTYGQAGGVLATNGTVDQPAYTFISESNSGMYLTGSKQVAISVSGANPVIFDHNDTTPQVLFGDGSNASPVISFQEDPNTGFFMSAPNWILFTAAGTNRMNIRSSALYPTSENGMTLGSTAIGWNTIYARGSGDSVTEASYTWGADDDTGLYHPGADIVGITAGGVEAARFVSSSANPQVLVAGGSAAEPSLAFNGDEDTGIYLATTNRLAFATAGTNRLTLKSDQFWPNGNIELGRAADPWTTTYSNIFLASNGSNTAPSIAFSSNDDIGFYTGGSNDIRVTLNGTWTYQFFTSAFSPIVTSVDLGTSGFEWEDGYINRILASTGSAAIPSYAFSDDLDTGVFRAGANQLGIAAGTGEVARFVNTGSNAQVLLASGSSDLPSVAFSADERSGFYQHVDGGLAATINGSTVLQMFNKQVLFNDSSVAAPAISFASDPDTGVVNSAGDTLALISSGTLIAGVIPSGFVVSIDGDASNPAIGFSGNSIGFFKVSTDTLAVCSDNWTPMQFTQSQSLARTGSIEAPGLSFQDNNAGIGVYKSNADNTAAVGLAANAKAVVFDGDAPRFAPATDDDIDLGVSSLRWKAVYAVSSVIGDLTMKDPGGGKQHWKLIEGHETIWLFNIQTGKKYRMGMEAAEMTADDESIIEHERSMYPELYGSE